MGFDDLLDLPMPKFDNIGPVQVGRHHVAVYCFMRGRNVVCLSEDSAGVYAKLKLPIYRESGQYAVCTFAKYIAHY
jgi:hypothetical protein